MKAFFKRLIEAVVLLILIPILLIAGLWFLLRTPFDKFRYKKSPYFAAFGRKYTFMVCYNSNYRIFNTLAENGIKEIVFHPTDDVEPYGYFTLFDLLIVCDMENLIEYDEKADHFYLCDPREDETDDTTDEDKTITLADYADYLVKDANTAHPEFALTRCVFLYDAEAKEEAFLSRIRKEPLLLPYQSKKDLVQALAALVQRESENP